MVINTPKIISTTFLPQKKIFFKGFQVKLQQGQTNIEKIRKKTTTCV